MKGALIASEHGLTTLLAKKFAAPEYAFLPQVRNCTGYGRKIRTADGLAMSLYHSRGLHLTGFEIKVDRADWKRELIAPEKADAIAGYCHFWYIVAASEEMVPVAELPPTWGLIVPDKKGLALRVVKVGLMMEAKVPDFVFLAGLLRKAAEVTLPKADIAKELELARHEGWDKGREEISHQFTRAEQNLNQLREQVREFEQRSGLSVGGRWRGPNLLTNAEVIDAMRGTPGRKREHELRGIIEHIEHVLIAARYQEQRLLAGQPEPEWSI